MTETKKQKKNPEEDNIEIISAQDIINKTLVKKYGKNSFCTGSDFIDSKEVIVPFSPRLDALLGGGVPYGSVVNLSGDPKCGKTLSALHLAGNAQKLGSNIYFLNVEARIKRRDILGIKNLDYEKIQIIQSSKESLLTAEQWLTIVEECINNDPRCVIIVDSVSQLATEKEINSDIGDAHRAPGAMLMSRFTKRNKDRIRVNEIILINIIHLIANTSGFGAAKVKSGGRKIQYAVDVDLEAVRVEPWKVSQNVDSEQFGQKVTWRSNSTALDAGPGKTESWIRYGLGIDEVYELVEMGVASGIIEQKGVWLSMDGAEQVQGKQKMYNLLKDNDELNILLRKNLNEMAGIK